MNKITNADFRTKYNDNGYGDAGDRKYLEDMSEVDQLTTLYEPVRLHVLE